MIVSLETCEITIAPIADHAAVYREEEIQC